MRTQLYSFSRRFYTSLDAINQPARQYYFVDTNIIVGYVRDQYDGIRDFIENHDRRFFYTETVKKELEKSKMDFPISEKYFEYVSSDLTEKQEIIEQTVNLSGFEHLIDVKLLLDAIKEDKKPNPTNIINCKI